MLGVLFLYKCRTLGYSFQPSKNRVYSTNSFQNVCPGESFSAALSGNSTPGSYSLSFSNTNTNGTGGIEEPVTITGYVDGDFPLMIDEDINGVLSFNQLPPLAGTWEVKVIVVDGADLDCDSTSSFTVNFLTANDPLCITVRMDENEVAQVNVYPNPSNGMFTIEIENVENHAGLTVMDVTGRQVYVATLMGNGTLKESINLDLNSGSYLLKIETGNKSHLSRIVIQ